MNFFLLAVCPLGEERTSGGRSRYRTCETENACAPAFERVNLFLLLPTPHQTRRPSDPHQRINVVPFSTRSVDPAAIQQTRLACFVAQASANRARPISARLSTRKVVWNRWGDDELQGQQGKQDSSLVYGTLPPGLEKTVPSSSPACPLQQLSALTLAAISLTTYPVLLDSAQDPPLPKTARVVSAAEVRKHNSRESCWVVVEAPEEGVYKVWDVTRWLDSHPGAYVFLSPTGV